MPKHSWTFKKHFRREAYGWKGTSLASKRMREGVSEIKKISRKDPSLAGEGVVELFVRLYPALMQIDSSSGALGTAMNKTIDTLLPILIQADWSMNTRGKWLENLYEAIQEDGWGTFDGLRDYWGELCVFPGLAHLWADRLLPTVREAFSSESYSYFVGADMCLSCLLFTDRHDEINKLLQLKRTTFWSYNKFWAKALIIQGKPEEALAYAHQILAQDRTGNDKHQIDEFCESLLIDMGRIEEAYQKYGLNIPSYGTYLNIYRGICKKYPTIDKRKILLDGMERTAEKGKWFAAAKNAGLLDIALDCAQSGDTEPSTLLRAVKDFRDKDPKFATVVALAAIQALLRGQGYELPVPADILTAYDYLSCVAQKAKMLDWAKAKLAKMVFKDFGYDPVMRRVIIDRLQREG